MQKISCVACLSNLFKKIFWLKIHLFGMSYLNKIEEYFDNMLSYWRIDLNAIFQKFLVIMKDTSWKMPQAP